MSANELSEEFDEHDQEEIRERSSPPGKIVYEAVMKEASEELGRSTSALFWSGLAAGLSMGFSLIAEAALKHALPEASWTPMVAKLGYSFGFLIVILGRQQLFTENTLTPILPLLRHKDAETLGNVARLWVVVFIANMVGAAAVSLVFARTPLLEEGVQSAIAELARQAVEPGFVTVLLRGIFAGWLIALLVWMLPYSESAHFFVILAITWLIGVLHLSHVIAGAVTVFAGAWAGTIGWGEALGGFIVPALIGNIIGGVLLVAALNHAQVVAGDDRAKQEEVDQHRSARIGDEPK